MLYTNSKKHKINFMPPRLHTHVIYLLSIFAQTIRIRNKDVFIFVASAAYMVFITPKARMKTRHYLGTDYARTTQLFERQTACIDV